MNDSINHQFFNFAFKYKYVAISEAKYFLI